ncbi:hypothetical protein LOTGIDRAFT_166065 [Lottia gigantea]|uniref:Uncharacterized protein n=1 Tax=Lottia gigantea TaxID=225164 RepID=V3ZAN5_LOTGI|nr:hypothetical protein LOTGIDRAFT_166065 [Lottia gigantea]ESO88038.1 hypothetical protein LOTGIDRAFT_166065 [Lottia gigantea]
MVKKISITKKLIDKYKYCKVRDDKVKFKSNSPIFKIDTKDLIFTLTKGLIDLMNGGYIHIADYKDLVAYSKFLHAIRKSGPDTRRLKAVDLYIKKVIGDENEDEESDDEYEVDEADDYAEDNSITQEIDEFEDMVSGQGITFLSDNNSDNRLQIILAAMKECHRSHRQYNEVNCILKRLLEKGIIDKNDYKNVK